MRILKLPLAGLLFCVMALFAGCKTSNEPKAPVALTWEMGASDIEPGYYENTFILKNISQKPLKKNWKISILRNAALLQREEQHYCYPCL